ncbi:ATM1-type heavy metal exporter [Nymphon striatum]|nr:ATM1-type heavy metal exporter [Nymphon striatum]
MPAKAEETPDVAAPYKKKCCPTFATAKRRNASGAIKAPDTTNQDVQLRRCIVCQRGQHAVRQLAYKTFVHIHFLSLRFHLERRTGGLSRIIERGTKGIESIVRFTILIPRQHYRIRFNRHHFWGCLWLGICRRKTHGLTDIEQMFDLLDVEAEISDDENAVPLEVTNGQ